MSSMASTRRRFRSTHSQSFEALFPAEHREELLDRWHADERVDHVLVIAGPPEFLDGVSHLIARAGRRVDGLLPQAADRAAIRVEVSLGDRPEMAATSPSIVIP